MVNICLYQQVGLVIRHSRPICKASGMRERQSDCAQHVRVWMLDCTSQHGHLGRFGSSGSLYNSNIVAQGRPLVVHIYGTISNSPMTNNSSTTSIAPYEAASNSFSASCSTTKATKPPTPTCHPRTGTGSPMAKKASCTSPLPWTAKSSTASSLTSSPPRSLCTKTPPKTTATACTSRSPNTAASCRLFTQASRALG
jgi:hypothetical protein